MQEDHSGYDTAGPVSYTHLNRDSVAVRAEVSSKLVPVKPIDGALLLGGTDAEPIVMEYTPRCV